MVGFELELPVTVAEKGHYNQYWTIINPLHTILLKEEHILTGSIPRAISTSLWSLHSQVSISFKTHDINPPNEGGHTKGLKHCSTSSTV